MEGNNVLHENINVGLVLGGRNIKQEKQTKWGKKNNNNKNLNKGHLL
jgi:hypothetical protein|tara:strand:+ start:442 stop:582 length:141 start_codon:yes stop_codon:yes gene_type:complete